MNHQPDVVAAILLDCQSRFGIDNAQACEIEMRARHQFGGDKYYVPREAPRSRQEVVHAVIATCRQAMNMSERDAFDVEMTARKKYGGRECRVGKRLDFLTPELIAQHTQQGETMQTVSSHYGITRQTLYNILRRGRKDEVLDALAPKNKTDAP